MAAVSCFNRTGSVAGLFRAGELARRLYKTPWQRSDRWHLNPRSFLHRRLPWSPDCPTKAATMITVRALLLGDRLDTAGLERHNVLSTTPMAFRIETGAFVVLFRYRSCRSRRNDLSAQEDEIIRNLDGRIIGRFARS